MCILKLRNTFLNNPCIKEEIRKYCEMNDKNRRYRTTRSTKSGPKLPEVGFAVRESSKKSCFVLFCFSLCPPLPRAKIGISQCDRQNSTLRLSVCPQ